jgi:hypothetical protein
MNFITQCSVFQEKLFRKTGIFPCNKLQTLISLFLWTLLKLSMFRAERQVAIYTTTALQLNITIHKHFVNFQHVSAFFGHPVWVTEQRKIHWVLSFNHLNNYILNLPSHICDMYRFYCIFLLEYFPEVGHKKTEKCDRITTCLYDIVLVSIIVQYLEYIWWLK